MTEKTLTTENIKPALDALRGELAPWPVVAKKQDRLNTAQLNAANSGITSSLVAQIIANTAAIRALESAITGTGLRALVVASLPAVGTTGILYIVPVTTYDPDTDADVVNYSNEYIWIPVEAGQASEGHYEQVGQTGIVINNGQLTITVNGTSVGTFTANQSGDTTAAITVPTNADYVDRTTDQTVAGDKTWTGEQSFTLPIVGSITGTAAKAIADEDGNSIKSTYGKLANANTWTNTQSFKDSAYTQGVAVTDRKQDIWKVTDSTNTAFGIWEAIQYTSGKQGFRLNTTNKYKNGDLDPTGNNVTVYFEFLQRSADGSSILKWTNGFIDNSVYPLVTNKYLLGNKSYQWSSVYAQSYYYNGTAWGLDKANVWSQNQSVINAITPKFILQDNRNDRTYSASTSLSGGVMRWECDDKDGAPLSRISTTWRSDKTVQLQLAIFNEDSNETEFDRTIRFVAGNSGSASLYPEQSSTTDLGTSTNKWKSLNGINPGALSLPDASAKVQIEIPASWVWDGTTENSYVAPITGWLAIGSSQATYVRLFNSNSLIGSVVRSPTSSDMRTYIPMIAGDTILISGITSSSFLIRIYPCIGNV